MSILGRMGTRGIVNLPRSMDILSLSSFRVGLVTPMAKVSLTARPSSLTNNNLSHPSSSPTSSKTNPDPLPPSFRRSSSNDSLSMGSHSTLPCRHLHHFQELSHSSPRAGRLASSSTAWEWYRVAPC